MNFTDYIAQVKEDAKQAIEENARYCSDWEEMNDLLFTDDSVTGNGSGSYTFNSYEAEQNIAHAIFDPEVIERFTEYGYTGIPTEKGAEAVDVIIRCIALGELSGELEGFYNETVEENRQVDECIKHISEVAQEEPMVFFENEVSGFEFSDSFFNGGKNRVMRITFSHDCKEHELKTLDGRAFVDRVELSEDIARELIENAFEFYAPEYGELADLREYVVTFPIFHVVSYRAIARDISEAVRKAREYVNDAYTNATLWQIAKDKGHTVNEAFAAFNVALAL